MLRGHKKSFGGGKFHSTLECISSLLKDKVRDTSSTLAAVTDIHRGRFAEWLLLEDGARRGNPSELQLHMDPAGTNENRTPQGKKAVGNGAVVLLGRQRISSLCS